MGTAAEGPPGSEGSSMPSWNIHIAQAERLLARDGACARFVRDANAFLFGSLVPDIPVGYMVPGAPHITYRETHFTEPVPIPKPDEERFWRSFVEPLVSAGSAVGPMLADESGFVPPADLARTPAIRGTSRTSVPYPDPPAPAPEVAHGRSVLDLALGAWAHLLADHIWNKRVNEYLDQIGGKPGEEFRIKKQADFDGFGRTLAISSVPLETPALLSAAEAFPQYPVAAPQVHDAIVVAHEIVRTNGVPEHLPYRLLTEEFFERVFDEVLAETDRLLADRLGSR